MKRLINLIVVHCSATPPDMNIRAATIRKWHTSPDPKDPSKPWKDIGYTYVIPRDGTLEKGRDLDKDGDVEEEIGAHAAYHNKNSIGICLVGGVDNNGKPESNFTNAQWITLEHLLVDLMRRFPGSRICGHRDLDNRKACPSFSVSAWLEKTPSLRRYA